MQTEPVTAHRIARPKRVAPTSRSCTFVVPKELYQHAARVALERSDNGLQLTYADCFREAIAQWCERNPIGSPASKPAALPPTPIEQVAQRNSLPRAVAESNAELEAAGFFVHARTSLARNTSACGLVDVPIDALCTEPSSVTCRNCERILERNAAALERRDATPATSPATKKRSSSSTKKPAKKTGGRRR